MRHHIKIIAHFISLNPSPVYLLNQKLSPKTSHQTINYIPIKHAKILSLKITDDEKIQSRVSNQLQQFFT